MQGNGNPPRAPQEISWDLFRIVNWSTQNNDAEFAGQRIAAQAMKKEFELLYRQRCAYCSGYGHSGNQCPTDAKLLLMRRGGTGDMRLVLINARKQARKAAGMINNKNYSKLSVAAGMLLKKRPSPNKGDIMNLEPPAKR